MFSRFCRKLKKCKKSNQNFAEADPKREMVSAIQSVCPEKNDKTMQNSFFLKTTPNYSFFGRLTPTDYYHDKHVSHSFSP